MQEWKLTFFPGENILFTGKKMRQGYIYSVEYFNIRSKTFQFRYLGISQFWPNGPAEPFDKPEPIRRYSPCLWQHSTPKRMEIKIQKKANFDLEIGQI